MTRKKLDLVLENVLIENVAAEGKAIAHYEGTVVFVEFAVPGDIVDIRIYKKKKNYMEGFILRMVKPSPHRLEPFCKHFGVCGGCKWQPLPYEMQLAAKQQQVEDQLVRIGHLQVPEIQAILPSEKTECYRNKLEFTFSNRRWLLDGEDPESIDEVHRQGLGFHVGRFFDKVVDIEECHLQSEPSNAIRNFIREYAFSHGLPFFDIRNHEGFLRNLIIRSNEKGELMQSALEFSETLVRDVYTPWASVVTVSANMSASDIAATIKNCQYSRLPYIDKHGRVIGVLHIRRFLKRFIAAGNGIRVESILSRPQFVTLEMPVDDLLPHMSKTKTHIAIVNDADGKAIGIITVEDILEELVGEIYDESDTPEPEAAQSCGFADHREAVNG